MIIIISVMISLDTGQMNGVCVSPTGKQGGGSPARRGAPDAVRRSKSQGTHSRKLQKCLSTVSYSDDGLLPPPSASASVSRLTAADRANLLVSRQYCSFGSTVTLINLTCHHPLLFYVSHYRVHFFCDVKSRAINFWFYLFWLSVYLLTILFLQQFFFLLFYVACMKQ